MIDIMDEILQQRTDFISKMGVPPLCLYLGQVERKLLYSHFNYENMSYKSKIRGQAHIFEMLIVPVSKRQWLGLGFGVGL